MITKDSSSRITEALTGLAILIIGIVIGTVAQPSLWLARMRAPLATPAPVLTLPMAQTQPAGTSIDNGLETLYIEIDPENAAVIQQVHDKAMQQGMIVQESDDLAPAIVRLGDKSVEARIRIKGDFLDHLKGDKWSLRIQLRGDKLMGMSRFSVQHPQTREYLWEWVIMKAARRAGLIAPRATFVNLVMNNNSTGIFYLEEHFTKEMLESQGRREGPIIRFADEAYWTNYLQHRHRQGGTLAPKPIDPSQHITVAEITAFSEKRLAQTEALARQLQHALEQMRYLQNLVSTQKSLPGEPMAKLQAKVDSQEKTIESILDTDIAARMHALMC
ncbi:MAG: CotH kinase family protein, partial [Planctomycetota bacterium]